MLEGFIPCCCSVLIFGKLDDHHVRCRNSGRCGGATPVNQGPDEALSIGIWSVIAYFPPLRCFVS